MIKQEKTIETYLASDGKEFSSEAACQQYEEALERDRHQEEIEEKVKSYEISYEEANYIPLELYMNEGMNVRNCKRKINNCRISFYLIKNKNQLKDLAEYLVLNDRYSRDHNKEHDKIYKSAKIKKFPCICAAGSALGWGREICTIYSDTEKLRKWYGLNGYQMGDIERKG